LDANSASADVRRPRFFLGTTQSTPAVVYPVGSRSRLPARSSDRAIQELSWPPGARSRGPASAHRFEEWCNASAFAPSAGSRCENG
jgi:hypothetical protein